MTSYLSENEAENLQNGDVHLTQIPELECLEIPWIRGPRVKKAVRRTSERSERSGTSGRMKSKPRSDELSQSHQSGTCSWSVQSQMTRWPHHTSKQQIWQQNNCTTGLDALLTG